MPLIVSYIPNSHRTGSLESVTSLIATVQAPYSQLHSLQVQYRPLTVSYIPYINSTGPLQSVTSLIATVHALDSQLPSL